MQTYRLPTQIVAVILAALIVISATPVYAAETSSRPASIGSVNAVGFVELRGVRIDGDGTLFSGDRMNVGPRAYAKVVLGTGHKVEVGAGSDVTVTRESDGVQVQMASGNVAFNAGKGSPVRMRIGNYEVTAKDNAAGNVSYVGRDAFGVRVVNGAVTVRNVQSKQSFSVKKGLDQVVSLTTGAVTPSFAQLASAVPSAVPAVPQQSRTNGMTRGSWLAVIGTVAGTAAAIAVLTSRNDDTDQDAATRLAQVQAISNLSAVTSSATATAALATTVKTTSTAALTAINNSSASNKSALQTSANAVAAKADSAASKVSSLSAKVAGLNSAIAAQAGPPTLAQETEMNQLIAELNAARNEANTALSDLQVLLSQATAAGVSGVPASPDVLPIPEPSVASLSIPR